MKLAKRFDLVLGYRYHKQSDDQYAFDLNAGIAAGITAPKPPGPNLEFTRGGIYDGIRSSDPGQHVSFDADTYRAALSWHVTDDVMLYVSYTEGFNSGGLAITCTSPGTEQWRAFVPYFETESATGNIAHQVKKYENTWTLQC